MDLKEFLDRLFDTPLWLNIVGLSLLNIFIWEFAFHVWFGK